MTDQQPPSESEDLGEPIAELAQLKEEPSSGFLHRIRSRIFDKMFAGDVLDFTLPVVLKMFMEYVSMVFSLFSSDPRKDTEKKR